MAWYQKNIYESYEDPYINRNRGLGACARQKTLINICRPLDFGACDVGACLMHLGCGFRLEGKQLEARFTGVNVASGDVFVMRGYGKPTVRGLR